MTRLGADLASRRERGQGASPMAPIPIYGNHLPPDAPPGLHLSVDQLYKLYARVFGETPGSQP